MQMNIKNPEACRMAQQLATATGKSLTTVVTEALAAELARMEAQKAEARARKIADINEILDSIRADLVKPLPTMEEIDAWLYDENGLPR
jgi:antitoxin VapB